MSVTVVIADDHAVVRDGLRAIMEAHGMIVVGEADTGMAALRVVQTLRPDVAVVDITMPGVGGIEATREICDHCPGTHVVILSMHGGPEYVSRALKAGASAYVLKECAATDVVGAVEAAARGHRYWSRQVADLVLEDYVRPHSPTPLADLSLREREVLQLVVEGCTSAEIGGLLCLSPKTVDTYRSRLMTKLGIGDMPGLVKFAIQNGLLKLD
jgi:DNA-binding NarL/FixJ family response regulator